MNNVKASELFCRGFCKLQLLYFLLITLKLKKTIQFCITFVNYLLERHPTQSSASGDYFNYLQHPYLPI
jgi:hypothetical protein